MSKNVEVSSVRKLRLIIILFAMVFFLSFFTQTVVRADSSIPFYEDPNLISNLNVKRDLYVNNYGVITIIDNFTIKNIGDEAKTYVQMGVPKKVDGITRNYDEKLISIEATGEGGEELLVEKLPYDGSGIQKWNIYLSNPLYPEEITYYLVEMIFYNLIDYSGYTQEGYRMLFYKFPSSAYNIENYELVMHRPERSSSSSSSGLTEMNISPWSATSYTWYYKIDTSSHSIIKCVYGKREITIDSWGYIQVTDFYRIKNIGDALLRSFVISIPSIAINGTFKAYDTTSSLLIEENYPETLSKNIFANITILWGNSRTPLVKNQETSIWLQYRLPLEQYISINGDKIKTTLNLIINNAEWPLEDFVIDLSLPTGASLISHPTSAQTITNSFGVTKISNTYDIITFKDNVNVDLEYYMFSNFFWELGRPVFILFISIIGLSAYIIVRREIQTEKIILTRPKLVASAIIREFISLYSEKIALDLDLETLEDNFRKGKIKKRNFRTQYKIHERKMLEVDNELKDLNAHFITAGGRFKKLIENLDLHEAEKIHARDGIKNLEKRYKMTGRISSAAFQKLKNENLKRLNKAKSNIDKIIEELRGYIA